MMMIYAKKHLPRHMMRRILALMLLAVLLMALPACQTDLVKKFDTQEELAQYLYGKVEENLFGKTSYEASQDVKMTINVKGKTEEDTDIKTESTMKGISRFRSDENGLIEYLETVSAETIVHVESSEEEPKPEKLEMTTGYADGTMFYSYAAGEKDALQLKSTTSAEEFMAYIRFEGAEIDILALDETCTDVTATRSEDGTTWTVSYSIGDKERLDAFMESYFSFGVMGSYTSTTLKVTCIMQDETFFPLSHEVVIDGKGQTNGLDTDLSMHYKETYKEIESDTSFEKVDLGAYKELEDLRVYLVAADTVKDTLNGPSGAYTMTSKLNLTSQKGSSETDHVSYGTKNGVFVYDIAYDLPKSKETGRLYYDGKFQHREVTKKGKTSESKASRSEAEARATLYGLVQNALWSDDDVKEVTQITSDAEGATLKIKLHSVAHAHTYCQALGIGYSTVTNDEMFITVQLNADGELTRVMVEFSMTFKYWSREMILSQTQEYSAFGEPDLSKVTPVEEPAETDAAL